MVGWHHRLSGHEPGQARTDREGQEAWQAAVHGVRRAGHGLVTGQQQQRVRQGQVAGKRGLRAHSQAISLRSLGRHSREVREENTLVRSRSEPNSSLKTQTRL